MFINPKIKVIGDCKKERFYCDICHYPLLSSEDFEKDSEYDCCHKCYLQFAESRRDEWKNGWRPKKAVVNSYISIRRKLYKQSSKEK
tara:strand:- start:2483 stop:2743 length:261 start_codon:yes stop_codon:yes gene_type:complete